MQKDLKSLFGNTTGLDEKSVDFLTAALGKNNLPGFDYLEFKQSLGALASLNMDEATSFKSAFATASTVGLTKDKLLQTAEHYKSILAKEKTQFDAALEKQTLQRVEAKKAEVEALRKKIVEFQEQIKQLEAKIAQAEATINGADESIRAAAEKIESTRESFEFTYQSLMNQIAMDIENIQKYL